MVGAVRHACSARWHVAMADPKHEVMQGPRPAAMVDLKHWREEMVGLMDDQADLAVEGDQAGQADREATPPAEGVQVAPVARLAARLAAVVAVARLAAVLVVPVRSVLCFAALLYCDCPTTMIVPMFFQPAEAAQSRRMRRVPRRRLCSCASCVSQRIVHDPPSPPFRAELD